MDPAMRAALRRYHQWHLLDAVSDDIEMGRSIEPVDTCWERMRAMITRCLEREGADPEPAHHAECGRRLPGVLRAIIRDRRSAAWYDMMGELDAPAS